MLSFLVENILFSRNETILCNQYKKTSVHDRFTAVTFISLPLVLIGQEKVIQEGILSQTQGHDGSILLT